MALHTSFINILNKLYDKGITNHKELMSHKDLYNELWFTTNDFVTFALNSKTGKKNSNGEIAPGNITKVESLIKSGITTNEDIHFECVTKIIVSLNLVLKQNPVSKQHNYCYKIVNNVVNTQLNKLPPENIQVVYFQDTIKDNTAASDKPRLYEDIIGDSSFNGEHLYIERESLLEYLKIYKKEKEMKRKLFIRNIMTLSQNPTEAFVYIGCTFLGIKPRELTSLIIDNGCENAYAQILFDAAKKNKMSITQLRFILKNNMVSNILLKANTMDKDIIAAQISRLAYRANERIKAIKHQENIPNSIKY